MQIAFSVSGLGRWVNGPGTTKELAAHSPQVANGFDRATVMGPPTCKAKREDQVIVRTRSRTKAPGASVGVVAMERLKFGTEDLGFGKVLGNMQAIGV